MKIIIAGSRGVNDMDDIRSAMAEAIFRWRIPMSDITEIVSGGARGADGLGEQLAEEHNIPVKKFIPDWDRFGKKAGVLRNIEMAKYADKLVAIWDGTSPGTKHMIDAMDNLGKDVWLETVWI